MIGPDWASKDLENAYQILWQLRQKQTGTMVLRAIVDAMDAIERADDEMTFARD